MTSPRKRARATTASAAPPGAVRSDVLGPDRDAANASGGIRRRAATEAERGRKRRRRIVALGRQDIGAADEARDEPVRGSL